MDQEFCLNEDSRTHENQREGDYCLGEPYDTHDYQQQRLLEIANHTAGDYGAEDSTLDRHPNEEVSFGLSEGEEHNGGCSQKSGDLPNHVKDAYIKKNEPKNREVNPNCRARGYLSTPNIEN